MKRKSNCLITTIIFKIIIIFVIIIIIIIVVLQSNNAEVDKWNKALEQLMIIIILSYDGIKL